MLLTIDPGTKAMGWALWEHSQMVDCGLARGKSWTEAVMQMPKISVSNLAIEDQQIYRTSQIDAHALLAVARVVGAVIAYYSFCPHRLVKPSKWKGQLPKNICGARTLSKLSSEEKALIGKAGCPRYLEHNLLDAIGIGLWATGRRSC